nr:family 10 glycosylhydrolase [Flammeovirgaceae bacterium]
MHGWMWTMPCTNQKIVKEHPDWYAVNGLGESAATKPAYVGYYKFLCPCHPEAQEFIRENVENLAQVEGLDGVHLDYVRLPDVILAEALQPKYNIVQDREFPQYDYSYSEHCRKAFKEQTGIDPLTDLKDPSANVEWRQFRQDSVSNLVNQKLAPEARKQNKMVTAAVFPNWPAVRQEWKTWDLDAFLPMLYHNFYNENLNWIGEKTKEEVNFVNNNQPVYSGLFVPSLTPKELKKAYQISIKSGGSGMALFDLNSLKDEHWEVLTKLLS